MPQNKKSDEDDQNLFSNQINKDFGSFSSWAKGVIDRHMAEKMWRMEMMGQISAYVRGQNRQIRESLDMRHSLADQNLYGLTKKNVLEEDIFAHFYPFCMLNCTGLTLFLLRKTSWKKMIFGAFVMVEYIYLLFNFPVEAWHFHRRALCSDKLYSQLIRDSYIAKFPNSPKAQIYVKVNELE